MDKFTLIGCPLGHSMSPMIHERLFALKKRVASYDLTEITPEAMNAGTADLKQWKGFNITIPHKQAIIPFLDEVSESAQRYGAVNCVVNRDGFLSGYNTDCDGFLRSVESFPMNGRVLLIGCGGVGRMMAVEAVLAGAELTLGILPRHTRLAAELTRELLALRPDAKIRTALTAELDEEFDVIMNASPVGMYPKTADCPVQDALIEKCGYVFDVIYNPAETLLIKKAKALGKTAVGGGAMLVLQAVKAHELWDGDFYTECEIQSIIDEMNALLKVQFPEEGGDR